MIIQCKTEEGLHYLAGFPFSIPLGGLKIDIDEDFISIEEAETFLKIEARDGK